MLLSVTCFLSIVIASALESPEPEPVDEGLYLYTAGFDPRYVAILSNGMNICTEDYPTGINIRCVGDSRLARFIVNGVRVRTEYKAPFYLTGDVRGRIRAWDQPPEEAIIECKLVDPKRDFKASVTFRC